MNTAFGQNNAAVLPSRLACNVTPFWLSSLSSARKEEKKNV